MTQEVNDMSPQQRSRSGPGCILPLLLTLIMAAALVAVALLLPPFNLLDRLLGDQYVILDGQRNAAQTPDGGLTLILNPDDPGEEFGVVLNQVPMEAFQSGTGASWVPAASAALSATLTLQSPVYTVDTTGTSPQSTTLSVQISETAGSPDLLDLYAWDGGTWAFVPSQPADERTLLAQVDTIPEQLALFQAARPSTNIVLTSVDVQQTLTDEVATVASIVAPAGLQPTLTGELTGSLASGVQTGSTYRVMPVVRNFTDPRALDIDTVIAILGNSTLRNEHVTQIATLAGAYDGIFIDYRNLPADQRENFSRFIRDLGQAMDARNLTLGVVLPAAQNASGAWETGAYDWRAVGAAADFVEIDLTGVDPTMFAPGGDRIVEAMLRWGTGEMSRYKILVGLSSQSVRQAGGGVFTPINFAEALSALGDVAIEGDLTADGGIIPGAEFTARLDGFRAETGADEASRTPYIDYLDENDNAIARVWLTNGEVLDFRMNRTREFALGGVAFNDLLGGDAVDEDILGAIASYKLGVPAQTGSTETEFALRWRIESASGVVDEITTDLNEPLVATIDAPPGNYAVNVAVLAESETVRRGAAVALAAPTATPTPLPSPTPSLTPTATNTPDPVAVAQAQAQATQAAVAVAAPASGPAVAPGPGSIQAGQFEYGGHVTSTTSDRAAGAMRTAGMSWMKVQIRYSPGAGTEQAVQAINGARERGFKILIGTTGAPQELGFGGQAYIQNYAQWLGSIAALNPDAIEVWNEPNIAREWPAGRISGEAYTAMLRESYNAIKSRNQGVIVISGAPAPTGAEAAFPGEVVNDDRFLREMVNAGALNYMDCVGVHYNEGIVGPSVRGGDPRDNYYTRYFGTMVDTYWNITGGQRPLCFTELGYLTSEGYPSLPSFFSWASGVTLQQHAAWLAEAIALSSQTGRVRLLIVWNVDFTRYGSDPQGGYAMIRPDGSCPACDAMARAR